MIVEQLAQSADPEVSRAKFDSEVANFRALAPQYGARGWFLAEAEFPRVLVVLAAPQLKPPPLVTGVSFDYTDYDLRPPSVRLVNPFTREPWGAEELPTTLPRRVEGQPLAIQGFQLPAGAAMPRIMQQQPLMQAYPGALPFLCIAGVREYHDHPAHSGDLWELHRPAGAGRLIRILEVIDTYGLRPLTGYNVNLTPQIVGYAQGDPPE
jgi:Predicted metal binding domain